jgi:hypothetical protein
MPVYVLIAVWILAMVPVVVQHRRAHRADALMSFAAFQARGRMLAADPAETSSPTAARRQRIAGIFVVALLVGVAVAGVVRKTWSVAAVAAMLHLSVAWYAAVVRSQLDRS